MRLPPLADEGLGIRMALSTLLSTLYFLSSARSLFFSWVSAPSFIMGSCSLVESQGNSGIHVMCFPTLQNYRPVGSLMPENSSAIYIYCSYMVGFSKICLFLSALTVVAAHGLFKLWASHCSGFSHCGP